MMEQESQDEENQTQVGSEIQIEYQGFLGHCKYSVIYYNNGYTLLYISHNK